MSKEGMDVRRSCDRSRATPGRRDRGRQGAPVALCNRATRDPENEIFAFTLQIRTNIYPSPPAAQTLPQEVPIWNTIATPPPGPMANGQ